ncbi:MAG: transglycosylase SLT domain-containing protein [Desulfobacteraceae bacterium]|nr:transglycosylase SLT domain-containing protein [Desulfobacteraceae bacterium]
MIKKLVLFFLILFCFLEPLYCSEKKTLIEILNSIETVSICGKNVPLEKTDVRERFEKELMLALHDRPQVLLWLKRSGRYFPQIEKILKEEGLPDDLKYVAVVESALRPHISSPQNAVGFWQFIHSTGALHGLKIDKSIDERCDIKKSTIAAAAYMKSLYERFNDWELALASYNIGEMRIERELEAQLSDNYYDLWLPDETMRYVFKVMAAKVIFEKKEEFGFYLNDSDYYSPVRKKKVMLELDYTIPALVCARALGLSLYEFKLLNTEIIGDYLIKGKSYINIPGGYDVEKFFADFKSLKDKWVNEHKIFYYSVKRGDSLIKIADEFEVRTKDILEWNKLDYNDYIYPGQKLVIKSSSQKLR